MEDEKENLEERLERDIKKHFEKYVSRFDKGEFGSDDLLEATIKSKKGDDNHIIDRDLLAPYLQLQASKRAEKDNRRLQRMFLAIAILAVAVPTVLEYLRFLKLIP